MSAPSSLFASSHVPPFRTAVEAVVAGQADRGAVHRLVQEAYRLSLAYLKQKIRAGRLQPALFGLSLDDLALDCVADLFQRDAEGTFEQLVAYFGAARWAALPDDELFVAYRRLVFSKVNESLFRRYREADPVLAKIVRNLKNAVKAREEVSLDRQTGAQWIRVHAGAEAGGGGLPAAPPEVLEAYLVRALRRDDSIQGAVQALVAFTALHPHYAAGYPLTQFAQVVRAALQRLCEPEETPEAAPFLGGEIDEAIHRATEGVALGMHASYVGRGKVDPQTFGTYFCAIRDILRAEFVSASRPVASYFEALQHYYPELSKGDYRSDHRHIVEYLTKLARARLVEHFQEAA